MILLIVLVVLPAIGAVSCFMLLRDRPVTPQVTTWLGGGILSAALVRRLLARKAAR